MEQIRLQKYLAEKGIASRRKCEQYILQGFVKVNGITVVELGTKVDPKTDKIYFKDRLIENKEEKKVYVLLNKPIGYVTTVEDQFHRETVLDLVKIAGIRLVPVGRLDMYTSGALILTNDGDFVYKVTHPKHEIVKTYTVTLKGKVEAKELEELKNGIEIEDYITKPAEVKIIKRDEETDITRLEIKIHEGRNRQVRKMCEAIGKKVIALHRAKIGDIGVKDLKIGEWKYLKQNEIKSVLDVRVK